MASSSQIPERLINRHSRVKLEGLHLKGVTRRNVRIPFAVIEDRLVFTTLPTRPDAAIRCSALRRGYVATFVLESDGRLRLTAFDYMIGHQKWQTQEVDELAVGDFWMVMNPEIGPRTYIPFRESVIVEDKEQWFTEDPFEARLERIRKRRQDADPLAAHVRNSN